MSTLEIMMTFVYLVLAALMGYSMARQGVVTGRATHLVGVYDVRIGGRRVCLDVLRFRADKIFYRLAVLPA